MLTLRFSVLLFASIALGSADISAAVTPRLVVAGGSASSATIAAGATFTVEIRIDAPDTSVIGAALRLSQTSPIATTGGLFRIVGVDRTGSPFSDLQGGATNAAILAEPGSLLLPGNAINLGNNSAGMAGIAPVNNLLLATITLVSDAATPAGTYRIQPTPNVSFVTEVSSDPAGADVPMDAAFFDVIVTRAAAGVPGKPIIGTAVASDQSISVAFSPPFADGGSAINGYTATCGGTNGIGAISPIVVSGLINGTSYACVVQSSNAVGTGPASDAASAVTPGAVFAISTTSSPVAGGSVTCSPNPVPQGGSSTCIASPVTGYRFSAFSGDCVASICVLTNISAARAVTANFAPVTFDVVTGASPRAGGTVLCGANPVAYGATTTCTATAMTGYTFASLTGDCNAVSGGICTLTNVTDNKRVLANFDDPMYVIGTTVTPANGGAITCAPNPVPQSVSSACTAVAAPGFTFTGFGGDCSGSACVFNNVTSGKAVTANFAFTASLNVDLSGAVTKYHVLTDGLMIVRYMQGLSGSALVNGVNIAGSGRPDPNDIAAYLTTIEPHLDIDGNGVMDAATDGLLVIRYMLGLRGSALTDGALATSPPATRTSAQAIQNWIAAMMP